MKYLLAALLAVSLSLTGCGNKGKLKTPSEIKAEQEKAARKEEAKKPKIAPAPDSNID